MTPGDGVTVSLWALLLVAAGALATIISLLRDNKELERERRAIRDENIANIQRLFARDQALDGIVQDTEMPCGCKPCTGDCYDRESLRAQMLVIRTQAQAALAWDPEPRWRRET